MLKILTTSNPKRLEEIYHDFLKTPNLKIWSCHAKVNFIGEGNSKYTLFIFHDILIRDEERQRELLPSGFTSTNSASHPVHELDKDFDNFLEEL
jgi:hypothetical protein